MKIYRVSELTGRTRSKDLPITEEQYYNYMCNYIDKLPELSEEQMLFLRTGIVNEELSCALDKDTR